MYIWVFVRDYTKKTTSWYIDYYKHAVFFVRKWRDTLEREIGSRIDGIHPDFMLFFQIVFFALIFLCS